ncbi:GNAT family N-acetyltransferase [Thiolapillus sp.]|uniref:GNAT family N-acetyltransferase n=2 Tax=Thiolapillus sp. TaxID=2017437 RepID=UPI0025F56D3E|nr:GNAT family N-acetyltransferase [Thiolapillus sp.]
MRIRDVQVGDAEILCAIYNHYIEHTTITFDEQSLQPEAFALQIEHVSQRYPWLVIEEKGQVLGYAYASEWGSRSAFRYTVASSIYLHPEAPKRKGMGEMLYRALLSQLADRGFCRVIAAIAVPNEGSVALHKKLGFSQAGYFHAMGYKFQRWIDVIYLELPLASGNSRV